MDETKQFYAIEDNGWRTLADAVNGADVFLGCSKAGALNLNGKNHGGESINLGIGKPNT